MAREKAPMICGGIYETKDSTGKALQGVLQAVTILSGKRRGMIRFYGLAEEHVVDETDRWGQFKLIGRPAAPNVGRPKKKA